MVQTRQKRSLNHAHSIGKEALRRGRRRSLSPPKTPVHNRHRQPLTEWKTPTKSAVLGDLEVYGDVLFDKEIYERHGVPDRTARYWKKRERDSRYPQARRQHHLLARRGRKPLISRDLLGRMEQTLQNSWPGRISTWEQLGASVGFTGSARTVQRAMYSEGYCKRIACQRKWLKPTHRIQRFEFSLERLDWPVERWYRVFFSDEVHFGLGVNRKHWVIRLRTERYCEECIQYRQKKEKQALHAWGIVAWNYKGPLYFYEGSGKNKALTQADYIKILEKHVKPLRDQVCNQEGFSDDDFLLLEDGDNSHGNRGKVDNKVKKYKRENRINSYKNPPFSPDLNIIENVWRIVKQRVKSRGLFATVQLLNDAILEEWNSLKVEEINKLINTMRDRIDEVWIREGKVTQF